MITLDKNKKILMLVESPNKVHKIQDITAVLGFKNLIVMATIGHTTNIKDNRNSYKNTGIHPEDNFRAEYAVTDDKKQVVANIKNQAKLADIILIASDPDREGENLGNQIKEILKLKDSDYYRIMYHSITKTDVEKALNTPSKMDKNLVAAAETRQIIDKLLGYALSPVVRNYLGCKSVGRCQSAGLKIIVDREKEIQNFIPQTYYDLYLNFTKNDTALQAKHIGTGNNKVDHFISKSAVDNVIAACTNDFIISDVTKVEHQESPKPPFCTSTFQQEAAKKLGLKVKDAMSIAQKLFENGFCNYHRTDDQTLAPEFISSLKQFIETNYGDVYTTPRTGKKAENAQEAHEALRCIDITLTPEKAKEKIKNELQWKVYKMIWQRTVACALPNAKISETVYTINNNEQLFKFSSKELIYPGYRVVYDTIKNEDEFVKETFEKDEVLQKTILDAQKKQTTPPARFSESSFIKVLEVAGIGRPSTYATIVENVLSESRGYCKLENKQMVPTDRGIQLVDYLDRSFSEVINLNYTKELEAQLDLIANGKITKLEVLQDFYNTLEYAISMNQEYGLTKEVRLCPNCGSELVVRRSKFGTLFRGCSNYPNCRHAESL